MSRRVALLAAVALLGCGETHGDVRDHGAVIDDVIDAGLADGLCAKLELAVIEPDAAVDLALAQLAAELTMSVDERLAARERIVAECQS
ncbi:MAG TPA: hypothetical protein VIX41_03570 [Acidimicrobiales bacterium]